MSTLPNKKWGDGCMLLEHCQCVIDLFNTSVNNTVVDMGIFKKRLFLGHASAGKPIRPPHITVSVSSWTTCKRDLYVGHPNWSLFPSILSIILSSYSRPVTSTISISILFCQKQYRYFPYHSINTEHTLRYLICHYVCYQRFCFSFKCVATVYFE